MAKQPKTTEETFEDIRMTVDQIRQLPESEIDELIRGAKFMISNFMPTNQMHILYNEEAHRITLLVNHEVMPLGQTSLEQIEALLRQRNTGVIDYTEMNSGSLPKDATEFVLPEYLSTHYPEFEMNAKVFVGFCLKFALGKDEAVDRIVQQEIEQGKREDTGNPILNRALFFKDIFETLSGALLMLEAVRSGLVPSETVERLLQEPSKPRSQKTTGKKNTEPPVIFSKRTVGRA